MAGNESVALETDRFRLRQMVAGDLDQVFLVFESNPEFLTFREDITTTGGYDRASVTRYWEGVSLEPDRHLLVAVDKKSNEVIGLVDFVDRSPADELPWVGLVIIHRSRQHGGAGTELLRALAEHLASQGHGALRMAVMESNRAGLDFAHGVGFVDYERAEATTSGRVVLMELRLPLKGETP